MATRCNIAIYDEDNRVWLYRHWDGYPSETGKDLARVLTEFQGDLHAVTLATAIVATGKQYEADAVNPARSAYEYTGGMHGDIEFVYVVTIRRVGRSAAKLTVQVDRVTRNSRESQFLGSLVEFAEWVAKQE